MTTAGNPAPPRTAEIRTRHHAFSTSGIHDDAVARSHGYRGAIVPGVALFARAVPAVVDALGDGWARRGLVQLRFRAPSYHCEPLTVIVDEPAQAGAGTVIGHIAVINGQGECCCDITIDNDPGDRTEPADWPDADVRPAEGAGSPEDRLLSTEHLGSVSLRIDPADVARYLEQIGETRDPFRAAGLVNPACLLRTSAESLHANGVGNLAGPSLHTASDLRLLRAAGFGEPLSLRGAVRKLFARHGHRYVTFDFAWLGRDGAEVVATNPHTMIYRLRRDTDDDGATRGPSRAH